MIDDRVWTVRFRRELADALRVRAQQDGLTVQQVIVRSVEALLGGTAPVINAGGPAKSDSDLYQYGGGPATPSRG